MIFTFSAITLAEIICVIKSTSLIALLMSLVPSKLLLIAGFENQYFKDTELLM